MAVVAGLSALCNKPEVFRVNQVVAAVPAVFLESVIEDLPVSVSAGQSPWDTAYVLDHQLTVERLTRPVPSKQALPHRARAAVTADKVVSLESELPFLLVRSASNYIHPCFRVILPDIGNSVVKANIDQALAPLQTVFVHDLYNHVQRQHRHAILFVLRGRQINAGQSPAIVLDTTPADIWKAFNACVSEVLEQSGSAEDASRRDAVLCRTEPLVEPVPGFEHQRWDTMLGEKQGEEQARWSRAGDQYLVNYL